jgi:hypothetical protein
MPVVPSHIANVNAPVVVLLTRMWRRIIYVAVLVSGGFVPPVTVGGLIKFVVVVAVKETGPIRMSLFAAMTTP